MKLFVSSLVFAGKSAEEMVSIAEKEEFALEFSSGLAHRPDMEDFCLSAKVEKIFHNYFPAPEISFVLNLASSNISIRERSIKHCIGGLELSKKAGASFFAAHAGFCIDPRPEELGTKITYSDMFVRDLHKELFIESCRIIGKHARKLKVAFLVENNVLAAPNYVNNLNPLLCCESLDINWLFSQIPADDYFGLLLDTAHLKVSCQTLKLSPDEELKKIKEYIKAIHHSDNDGMVDNNKILGPDYWFCPYISHYKDIPQVLEVKNLEVNAIHQQLQLLKSHGY